MKFRVSILFIVIQAISCEKAVSNIRKKLMVPKMNEECKKIKCPSVEDPVCLKMTRHDLGRSMYIVAANKCELDYIKCHDDVEAKIVPMKYCGHNTVPIVEDKKNKTSKHIRVKRRIAKLPINSMHAQASDHQIKLLKLHKARLMRKKLARIQRNNVISKVINKYSVLSNINRLKKNHGADQHGRQNSLRFLVSESDSDWEDNERLKIAKGIRSIIQGLTRPLTKPSTKHSVHQRIAGHEFIIMSEWEHPMDFSNIMGDMIPLKMKKLNKVPKIQEQPQQQVQLQLSLNLDDFDMLSEEFNNTSKDTKDYDTLCPTVCPSRVVMVCGRCQHGVYRTFLSVCHMKMFGCYNDDEVLELISRYPCVLSAPYLSEEAMKPEGRIREPGDDDEIIRFLNCQERGKGFVKDLNGKISCAANFLKDPAERYKAGDRFFYFPGDGDDTMHVVDAKQPIDFKFIKKITKNPGNYGYWLYTRYNYDSAQIIRFGDASSVAESNFDFAKVTVISAHGWIGDGNNEMNRLLREAFLNDADVNIIIFDWSGVAKKFYTTARAATAEVGRGLGKFIKWLVSLGASYEKIHLVGFSLGAHLVGNAGRETGSSVRRITALDPAYPLWKGDKGRVVASDAKYVEVIHTNTRLFGWTDPCGHADFYPNGGYKQPGCFWNTCCHSLAYRFLASSVENNHLLANKCATLSEANNDNLQFKCTGEPYPMGNSDLSKSRSGLFRVNTRANYPY